jgi:prevent-host-death family protein
MAGSAWNLAEAKARFSEVVEKARTEGPQHVSRNGKEAVVVVAADEWRRVTGGGKSFIEALLNPAARVLSSEEAETLFARDPDVGRPVDL